MTHGCFNRPPFKASHPVADGYFMDGHTRTPRMVPVPHVMTTDCQYSKHDRYNDAGCNGCTHKQTPSTAGIPTAPPGGKQAEDLSESRTLTQIGRK